VRYSTTGTSSLENAQPVVVSTAYGEIALAHNGDIVNADALRAELQEKGWAFATSTDSEIIVRLLANELTVSGDMVKAIKNLTRILAGSYSLAILFAGKVFGLRDPHAIKPLVLGKLQNGYGIASETVVFDFLGGTALRDVAAGEVVVIDNKGYTSHGARSNAPKAHCMFEWVYFARPDAVLEGVLVYEVRKRLGEKLAEREQVEADIVVPVPDSGRAYALGYSETSGLQYVEGLIKNRFVERTFIMPEQKARELSVKLKLNPVRQLLCGKRVVLIDDSIVRGTTMREIVRLLRKGGAREVHVRIGSPPIVAPCYLGIDMKTRDQFIALERTWDEIAKILTADSVAYVPLETLVECIGKDARDLCLGCLTAEYPVEIKGEKFRGQQVLEYYIEEGR
jgi:amidophosphoribosyltransferase